MSGAEEASGNENLCVVCFKEVEIFSVGSCNHPVCYECSTIMRVLCQQNECPICRQDVPKVIFTKTKVSYNELIRQFEKTNLQDRKFGILFCSSEIQKAYYKILEHNCSICKEYDKKWPFRTFQQLQDHMRKEHELYYCDICVENLKIFTFERRCYTRQELAHHRRKGDLDNTSHRGHPLCEFCDKRFVDNDDLFRHLRKIHHYCHFCDADGKNQYYMNLEDLFAHFEEEHFICKEGECTLNPFTSVFRSKIDLQAHIATEHSRNMSKSATKQARTLELEFSLARRPQVDIRSRQAGVHREYEEPVRLLDNVTTHSVQFDPSSSQDFPALAGSSNTVTLRMGLPSNSKSFSLSKLSQNDFPTLGGARNVASTSSGPIQKSATLPKPTSSKPIASVVVSNARSTQQKAPKAQKQLGKSKSSRPPNTLDEINDFPALTTCKSNGSTTTFRINSPNVIPPKVSLVRVNPQPIPTSNGHSGFNNFHSGTESFPTLGEPNSVTKPQWVKGKSKKKSEPKKKTVPAPELPSNSLEQFPSLTGTNSKSKSAPGPNGKADVKNKTGKTTTEQKKKVEPASRASWSNSEVQKQKSKNGSQNNGGGKNKKAVESQKISAQSNNNEFPSLQKQKSNGATQNKKLESAVQKHNMESVEMETSQNSNMKKNSDSTKTETLIDVVLSQGKSNKATNDDHVTKPPPGFNTKPPPGFDMSSFPSLGRMANTPPMPPGFERSDFCPPTNFQGRNNRLIKKVIADTDNNTVREFKTKSDEFRKDILPAEKYYDHCKTILGHNFEDIFPELLVLLPDRQKQLALYSIYDGKNKKSLVVCEQCKQVVFSKELSEHYYFHLLDNQFPSLNS